MKRLFFGISFLFAGALILSSCIKDKFDLDRLSTEMEFEPGLAAPFLYGSFDMDDLVDVIDTNDYSLKDEDGLAYYLVYADTIYSVDETVALEFELTENMISYFQINMETFNEMAIETHMQIYMEDENHVVLDSVFDMQGIVVEPSSIDSDGKLLAASENGNSSTFNDEKIAILDDIAFLRISTTMQPTKLGEPFVKIYASYSLDYVLSMSANAKINTRDLN